MKVSELKAKLAKAPDEAEVVLDTSIVMGNYSECLPLNIVEASNDGKFVTLVTVPDQEILQPSRIFSHQL